MSTILVVDDMAIFREPLTAALCQRGYDAQQANDGVEALSRVAQNPPDLILMDINMPRLDGIEVLRRLRNNQRTQDIPVIFLTACTNREYVVQAAKLGVRDYLLKSAFSLDLLLSRIKAGLECRAAVARGASADSPAAGVAQVKRAPAPADLNISTATSTSAVALAEAPPPTAAPAMNKAVIKAVKTTVQAPRPEVSPATARPSSSTTALESLKSLKPIISRSQISEKIETLGEIRAMSPSISQIIKLTSSENTSLDAIVRAVRQDQAIALKILKLANSVVYTRGEAVESVHKAVMRIGLAQIRQAALNFSVIDHFQVGDLDGQLSISHFWEHSIACGLIAAEITHLNGGNAEDADRAFTMGLLHDVGRMIYAEQMTEEYRSVMEASNRLQLPLEQVESRMLLINHADLMDRVLHLWRFPKELVTPIALHHLSIGNIRQVAPSMVNQVATLALANCLAHALLLGSSGNLAVYPTHELARSLRLEPSVIQRIVEVIPDQTQDIKLAMVANSRQEHWEPMSDQIRKQIGVPLHPVVITAAPGIDAFEILARCLQDTSNPGPANLGIVHIAQASERIMATTKLKQAEAGAGGERLPLVILSPAGNLTLEESAMAGRRVELLPYPLALSRWVAAVRNVLGE